MFIGPSEMLVQFFVCFKSFTENVCIWSAMLQYFYFSSYGYYSVCHFVFMSCSEILFPDSVPTFLPDCHRKHGNVLGLIWSCLSASRM